MMLRKLEVEEGLLFLTGSSSKKWLIRKRWGTWYVWAPFSKRHLYEYSGWPLTSFNGEWK